MTCSSRLNRSRSVSAAVYASLTAAANASSPASAGTPSGNASPSWRSTIACRRVIDLPSLGRAAWFYVKKRPRPGDLETTDHLNGPGDRPNHHDAAHALGHHRRRFTDHATADR